MAEDVEDIEKFGESVLPEEIKEPAVPIPLNELMPWHHPRKQYVREQQWKLYAERYVKRLQSKRRLPGGEVRYLTLPGIDYFDVEILGNMINKLGLELEATGFHAETEKEPVRARSQFRADSLIKRGIMKDTSITFPYRLEDLANRNSQAYREITSRAPFHVVNIDACGSMARPAANQPNRIIDAIHKLLELQCSGNTNWVLFLTTDARYNNLSKIVRDALKKAIKENSRQSGEFAQGALELLSRGDAGNIDEALALADADAKRFLSMFSLGFSKWILHLADEADWDLESQKFYCYSTRPKVEDGPSMACLAFEFCRRPVVIPDKFGAIDKQPVEKNKQVDFSMQALRRTQAIDNLDELLMNDMEVKKQYVSSQRKLLVDAGYQAAALDEFDKMFS